MPALQFTQESTSDPGPSPRSPAGVPPDTKDRQGVADPEGQDGQDGSSEQPVDTPGLEAGSKSSFPWSLPAAQAGESGSVGAEAFRVLLDPEAEPSPQGLSPPLQSPAGSRKQSQAPDLSDKSLWPEPDSFKLPMEKEVLRENLKDLGLESQGAKALPEGAAEPSLSLEPVSQVPTEMPVQGEAHLARQESHPRDFQEAPGQVLNLDSLSTHLLQSPQVQPRPEEGNSGEGGQEDSGPEQANETHGLEARNPESPQQDDPLSDTSQVPAERKVLAPGKISPPRGSPLMGLGAGLAVGAPETTQALLTLAESEAQPRSISIPMQVESKPDTSQPTEPGALSRLEDPGTNSGEAELTFPGDLTAGKPQADPDYLYHVIFLGDSNVGKTSFLYLLHHDAFATGLAATVGKAPWGTSTGGEVLGQGQQARAVHKEAIPDMAGSALATGLHEALFYMGIILAFH